MSTAKKIGRVIAWLLFNSTIYTLMILGLIGISWAWNLYVFLSWVLVIGYISLLIGKGTDPSLPSQPTFQRPVPGWIDITVDLFGAAVLAALGHWFYAALKVTEVCEYESFYSKPDKLPS